MLTKQLADEIVEQTMIRLNRNLNVMDTNGMILASGEKIRINKIHEGAAFVAKTEEVLWITEENMAEWHGTKPGVNMPIHFQQQLVGVIGITGNPVDLREIATLVQLTTEMMVHQSLITSRAEWKRKMKELIFEELVSGEPLSLIVKERLSLLGFSIKNPFVTLLIEFKSFAPSSQRIIEKLEDQFEKNTVLIGHSQLNEIFILISGMTETTLKRKLSTLLPILQKDSFVRIGVGYSVDSLDEIRYSYTTAKNALLFAQTTQHLIYFEDVELLALLKRDSSSSETARFSNRVLNGLNEQLRHSLSVYFSCNQNNSIAASTLEIHRHTLKYRLRKIEEISGYNPSLFHDAVLLKIALLLDEK
ncbi:sugar diacid utilization regulator SdaR [Sporosarcina sp. ANT_H38]|uniref:CdaR family transcriptional regulator n=1 Tax=Sporosarcina sp. ANT_H38 TaxID=2597358 RepID=UPI0011F374EE|nr:sugar diacid recognition domain-containing protein [Sporosarcina sp. ANT_H38]KAA0965905.1 sugar diacid utilization regulator SdaR [Sporosarcina sp. ANT_H38]